MRDTHVCETQTYGWIRLSGLHVDGVRVGIYPHEKNSQQSVVIDVGLWLDVAKAALSEKIEDTVDYDAVTALVRKESRARYCPLLETLCENIARALLKHFSVERVHVAVVKPGALARGSVSISVERSRESIR